jgi:flavodoxin
MKTKDEIAVTIQNSSEMEQTISRRKTLGLFAGVFGVLLVNPLPAFQIKPDGITSATTKRISTDRFVRPDSKVLLVLMSFHHNNTKKIADIMAETFGALIKTPEQVTDEDFHKYELIGFGSGIYHQQHSKKLLKLVDGIDKHPGKKAFIFSTSGVARDFAIKHNIDDPHTVLRDKLLDKEFSIMGEYNCPGWNTNKSMKYIGGLNKGRPGAKDRRRAKEFASNINQMIGSVSSPIELKN